MEHSGTTAREEGATLSPPNTWTESAEQDSEEDVVDNRHLFTVVVSLPEGTILDSRIVSDNVPSENLSTDIILLLLPSHQPAVDGPLEARLDHGPVAPVLAGTNKQLVCTQFEPSQLIAPSDDYFILKLGSNFFPSLQGKGQSFLLSAAATSSRQRLFCRVNCGSMSYACELLCEFEASRARVTALALRAAYGPSTPFHSLTFSTKHAANCALTHVDYTSIPYLGHLPTDLIGRSILAFVYAPDVHVIRQAHIDLHNSRGKVVKSVAPLRFVAHNGALLRSETEWSAYVNPWTKKIELVVARHRIVDAPIGDANVLASAPEGQSMSVLPAAMAKTFEDELKALMNKPVPSARSVGMCQAAPRPSDLSSYIDRLVETLVVNGPNHTQVAKINYYLNNIITNLNDEYRDTWNRRLKRMSVDTLPGSPSSKQMRPSTSSTPPTHWTPAQREEYYRSLAPNPPPPPGKNFQITTVPLPSVDDKIAPISLLERQSAFTAVLPKSLPVRDLPAPIVLSIQEHPSVIQAPSDQQIMSKDLLHPSTSRLHWAYGRLGCVSSPPPAQPIKLATDALLMLHETA
uniref:PAS domain-containing protein n=1 Tax=Heterorhabditis bacteriophora TaxID=37862 RepID=A0A1I7XBP1_HETBA